MACYSKSLVVDYYGRFGYHKVSPGDATAPWFASPDFTPQAQRVTLSAPVHADPQVPPFSTGKRADRRGAEGSRTARRDRGGNIKGQT